MEFIQTTLVILILIKLMFEAFIARLSLKKIHQQRSLLPKAVSNYMDSIVWQRCTDYTIAKTKFGRFENFVSCIFLIFVLLFLLPWFYSQWETLGDFGILWSSFLTTLFLLAIQQISLPFDWYRQFKLEESFNFNKQTTRLWVSDKIKELILGLVLLGTVIFILFFLYEKMSLLVGDYWWILAFVTLFLFQIFLMVLWPRFILPLFNKLTRLEDLELEDKLQALAQKTGFKSQEILVIDGSKRSSHSNAFFTGFGKFRKIVLYDTLLKQLNHEEIVAVVAHEIGHYRLGHIPKRLFVSFVLGLLCFWIIHKLLVSSWFTTGLNLPSVFAGELSPVLITVILFGGAFTFWTSPLSNYFSHKHEYEADRFAADSGNSRDSLLSALKKLSTENLSYPLPHRLVSVFYHSHPSLPQRDLNLNPSG
jgi:STE24 endopeptidase